VINHFFVIHHFFLFGLVGGPRDGRRYRQQLKKLLDDELAKISGHIGGQPRRLT
jgi:hypothetical protein